MGGFAVPTELYLCEVDAGMHPKRSLDIFYHYDYEHFNRALVNPVKPKDAICNEQLDKMFGRHLKIVELSRPVDNLVRMLPGIGSNFVVQTPGPEDLLGLFDRSPTHVNFTEEEEAHGLAQLEQMGVNPGSPFVCFHARDGNWLPAARPRLASVYGDWNIGEQRNTSISNYLPATEKLLELGYQPIRMGKFVAEALEGAHPDVIDYPTRFHSDFMDIFLSSRCEFFLGQNSGMTGIPLILRRPVAFVNVFALDTINYCANEPNIFIPKLLYSEEKGRFLNFREIFDSGLTSYSPISPKYKEISEQLGLKIVENTADEISGVVVEMHQRLRSEFEESKEIEELRNRFLDIVRAHPQAVPFEESRYQHLKLASSFLKKYPESVG